MPSTSRISSRTGGAAVAVAEHLRLVHHGDVHRVAERAHLHRRGDVPAPRRGDALLAGDEGGEDAARRQRFPELVRQEPQRRQGKAALGRGQLVERRVALAGVGGAGDERDAPVERARARLQRVAAAALVLSTDASPEAVLPLLMPGRVAA